MGRISNDGAYVYRSADFDAKVIAQLRKNSSYPISSKVTGAFYKIKLRDGLYGFIADTDVEPLLSANEQKQKAIEDRRQKEIQRQKKRKPYEWERYRGFELSQIAYSEDTMGGKPKENLWFYGAKFTGPNTLMHGNYTDANLLFHFGAPSYYEAATGQGASGFAILGDFLFENASPQGRNTLLFYGFGPMVKYTKWDVALKVNGREEAYDLTDMTLGAVFNLGLSQRFDGFALRGELKYYWEKTQYFAVALTAQLPF